MTSDASAAPMTDEARRVAEAITYVREAVDLTVAKPGPYGESPRTDLGDAPKRVADALADLEAEAAREHPDVQVLGKHMKAVSVGAGWMGSRLTYVAEFQAGAAGLQHAVIEQQTELATRGLSPGARHLVLADMNGHQAFYDIRDEDTLRSVAQRAAVHGLELEEAAGPPDISGLAPAQAKLYRAAVEHGWNVVLDRGSNSADEPIETVQASHPGSGEKSSQSYIGGKRAHYGAEPVKTSIARIAARPRGEYAGQQTAPVPDLEA